MEQQLGAFLNLNTGVLFGSNSSTQREMRASMWYFLSEVFFPRCWNKSLQCFLWSNPCFIKPDYRSLYYHCRKPRINSQLVAQQVAQQYATPPPPKKEKKEKVEKQDKEKPDKEKEISPSVTKKNTNKKTK